MVQHRNGVQPRAYARKGYKLQGLCFRTKVGREANWIAKLWPIKLARLEMNPIMVMMAQSTLIDINHHWVQHQLSLLLSLISFIQVVGARRTENCWQHLLWFLPFAAVLGARWACPSSFCSQDTVCFGVLLALVFALLAVFGAGRLVYAVFQCS